MASPKISVYNLVELKTTSDDAISNYLNSLKFRQSHGLTDTRLALGYSSFAIAAACWFWDYKLGFEATKLYTAVAVVLYTILNCALTAWVWFWERGTVYEGTAPSGEKISITSVVTKHVPTYDLSVSVASASGRATSPTVFRLSRPFAEWFDAQGTFIAHPFQEMLATSVPLIGKLDPVRVNTASHKLVAESPEILDSLLGQTDAEKTLDVDESAKTTGTAGRKGGKKRRG